MAKAIKCPNCGASQSKKISENEYECDFCDTKFHLDNKNLSSDILNALKQANNYKVHTPVPGLKTFKILPIMIFMVVLGVSFSVFFSMKSTIGNAVEKADNTLNNQSVDDYWGSESIHKFYVFQGKKSSVVWELINQNSKGLDSVKYSIRIINPANKKTLSNSVFMTMTRDESFHFQNYLSEIISFNEKVYVLSDENGLNIYDLYSGKLKIDSEKFCKQFDELKSGIVSAKWQGYRKSIELVTKDGFKYYFLPQWEKLVSENQYTDYSATRKMKNAFVLTEGERPQLFFVYGKMDSLRDDYSVSDYSLKEAISGKFRKGDIEKLMPFSEEKVFFNAKVVFKNDSQILVLHTENLAKNSTGFLTLIEYENEIKLKWEIKISELPGFENLIKDDVYFQNNHNQKEVAIWYWNATKKAISLDLNSGRINWSFSI